MASMANSGEHEGSSSPAHKREPLKSSVGNIAVEKRRQHAVMVGKERREAAIHAKRLCRNGVMDVTDALSDDDAIVDDDEAILDAQTFAAVEELKSAISYIGKGAAQKKIQLLRSLRRLLSKSSIPPIEAALQAGAVPVLVQCLSFGSQDEQLLEAAWCLTNIAAGEPEQTQALLPALPLLIAHLGEKSSIHVAEQCAWAIGNLAGEGVETRNILLAQGALPPLARMLLSNRGSTARTAAWTLSNLIKGPDPKAATELIKINGVLESIIQHLKKTGDELATEVSWVVVYLSALSNFAVDKIVKSEVVHLLVERLAASEQIQLLIPILRTIGNLVAGNTYMMDAVLVVGHSTTDKILWGLINCLKSEHRVLKKEAAWVLSNIAAGSLDHKRLIYSSEAVSLLLQLLSTASFDIKKETAYALGNICVLPAEGPGRPEIVLDHLAALVDRGCLSGFISLVRSLDVEAARLGLQFLELVMRGLPNGEGPKLVEKEDGIDAMERFQFHENEDLRNMATKLVDTYFGEDYGLDEA